MRKLLILTLLLSSSCSIKQFYPLGGSVLGGGVGALGGPGTAAAGAGVGYTVGELAKGNEELQEAQKTIRALTTGDVETLVEQRMEDAKNNGFFSDILDGFYDILILSCLGIALFNIVPIIYTRYVHKRQNDERIRKTE